MFFQPFGRRREEIDEEQYQSAVPQETSGLQWFFESLDKPAAALRSAMQGDWKAAGWHITPFSDTIGGTMGIKPPDRHYWGDYLRDKGWEDNWKTAAVGFAGDIVTDPMFMFGINALLPGVGKATITPAGRALGHHRTSLKSMTDWANQLHRVESAGEAGAPTRALFGGTKYPFGIDKYFNKSFEPATWQTNVLPGKLGEKVAGWYADAVLKNPLTRGVRSAFSAIPFVGSGTKQAQAEFSGLMRDVGADAQQVASQAMHAAKDGAMAINDLKASHNAFEDISTHLNQMVGHSLSNDNIVDAVKMEDFWRETVENSGPIETVESIARQVNSGAFQPMGDRLSLMRQLVENPESLSAAKKAEALAAQQGFQKDLASRMKEAGYRDEQIGKAMGYLDANGQPVAPFSEATGTMDQLIKVKDKVRLEVFKRTGVQMAEPGTTSGVGHFPRQITGTGSALGSPAFKGGTENPFEIARKPWLQNGSAVVRDATGQPMRMVNGSAMTNTMSRDPILVAAGTNFSEEVANLATKVPVRALAAAPGEELLHSVVRLGDRTGYVTNYAGGMFEVKVAGTEGIQRLKPDQITGLYDAAHSQYDELREMAQYELRRTGKYDGAKAMEHLKQNYQYKYTPTPDELWGADANTAAQVTEQLNIDRAGELHQFLAKQPVDILKKGGVFNNTLGQDLSSYIKDATMTIQAHEYASTMFAHAASAEKSGVTMLEALQDMYGKQLTPEIAQQYVDKLRVTADGFVGSEGMSRVRPNAKVSAALTKASAAANSSNPYRVLSHLYVPQGAGKVAAKFTEMHSGAEPATGKIVEFMRKVTQAFKATAYGVFPQSQARNLASGAVMNAAGGMFSPLNQYKAWKWAMTSGKREAKLAVKGVTDDVVHVGWAHGIYDDNRTMEALGGASGAIPELPANTVAGNLSRLFTAGFGTAPYTNAGQHGMASPLKELGSVWGIGKVNPGDAGLTFGNPKVQQQSTLLSGTRNIGNLVEFTNRTAGFMTLLERGWTPAQAARHVKAIHYDYSSLSTLDRQLKDFMPFWTWMRKNLPMQVKLALEDSGGFTANAVRGAAGLSRYQDLPKGMEEATSFSQPIDAKTSLAYSIQGVFPWEDLHRLGTSGSGATGMIPGVNMRSVEKMAGMMAPPITATVQALTGRELFSGQSIRDSKLATATGSPQAAQVARAFLGRPIGFVQNVYEAADTAKAGEPAKLQSALQRLLIRATVGGVRTQEFYPEEEKLRRQRETLERFLRTQPGVGFFERPFIRGGDQAPEHLQEANRLLSNVVQRHQEVRAARQAQ